MHQDHIDRNKRHVFNAIKMQNPLLFPLPPPRSNYYRCWRIEAAEPGQVIALWSLEFQVEFQSHCEWDAFYVYGKIIISFSPFSGAVR